MSHPLHTLCVFTAGLLFGVTAHAVETKDAKDPKAAKPAKSTFEVRQSVYAPKSARDPFLSAAAAATAKTVAAASITDFNLQGILYHPTKPSAMINNTLVLLQKPSLVPVGSGKVEVRALEITRTSVKLQVGEQTVDLHLEPVKPPAATAPPKPGAAAATAADSAPGTTTIAAATTPAAATKTTEPTAGTATGGGR